MSLKSWIRSWLEIDEERDSEEEQKDVDFGIRKLEDDDCVYAIVLDISDRRLKEINQYLEHEVFPQFDDAGFVVMSGKIGRNVEVVSSTVEDLFPRHFCSNCSERMYWDKEQKETYCAVCES